jgi:hypothetical protein
LKEAVGIDVVISLLATTAAIAVVLTRPRRR